jgi:ATP adenylyltransferase
VAGTASPSACIFCNAIGPEPDPARDALVLVRGRLSFVILNLYPYNNGHLMVAPNRHIGSLGAATADELAEMMRFTRGAEAALNEAYSPEGINMGLNLGRPAGAGIVDHIHIHAVPRWTGDTNFMTVFGNTRVLPEDIGATAKRLRPIFERLLQADGFDTKDTKDTKDQT